LNPGAAEADEGCAGDAGLGSRETANGVYASWPLEKVDSVHPKHRGRLFPPRARWWIRSTDLWRGRKSAELNLIKMDVDGHELPVLQGGRSVLREQRPVIVMEMSPYVHAEEQNSFAAVIELLKEFRYKIEDARNRRTLPLDAAALERLIPDGARHQCCSAAEQ